MKSLDLRSCFSRKNRRRYSRERASERSLKNGIIQNAPMAIPDAPSRALRPRAAALSVGQVPLSASSLFGSFLGPPRSVRIVACLLFLNHRYFSSFGRSCTPACRDSARMGASRANRSLFWHFEVGAVSSILGDH